MYVQVKEKLQKQSLEKKYEGYKLEEDIDFLLMRAECIFQMWQI